MLYNDFHMGITGEIVAQRHNVTREEADRFALGSYRKAVEAIKAGAFKDEIVPVEVSLPNGLLGLFERDECVREDTTLGGASSPKTSFSAQRRPHSG